MPWKYAIFVIIALSLTFPEYPVAWPTPPKRLRRLDAGMKGYLNPFPRGLIPRRKVRDLLILAVGALRFLKIEGSSDCGKFMSGEDCWMCKNGKWVKHGNPSASAPAAPCRTDSSKGRTTEI